MLHHVRGQIRRHDRVERRLEHDEQDDERPREGRSLGQGNDPLPARDVPEPADATRVEQRTDDHHDEEELLSHRYG